MDINDNNLRILTEYLTSTLNPDPAVRRPGKCEKANQLQNAEKSKLMKFKFRYFTLQPNNF